MAIHIQRRELLAGLGGAAAWPVVARAQDTGRIPHVGWLWPGRSAGNPNEVAGFKQGLRELGYIEGKNIAVEYRFGENSTERLTDGATDIARIKVSVILAFGQQGVSAAQRAAPGTPLVFLTGEPIRGGVVTNLREPGGNLTGVSVMRLAGKWPELVKEALPAIRRVGYLLDPTYSSGVFSRDDARRSAEALRMDFQTYTVQRPEELERTFAAMKKDGIEVVLFDAGTILGLADWSRGASLSLGHQLASISETRDYAAAGGLMSYGASVFDAARRMAHYVDKILKGARASDLPVEQPTKFELVINLKTAKALGLQITPTLLARADEVIER